MILLWIEIQQLTSDSKTRKKTVVDRKTCIWCDCENFTILVQHVFINLIYLLLIFFLNFISPVRLIYVASSSSLLPLILFIFNAFIVFSFLYLTQGMPLLCLNYCWIKERSLQKSFTSTKPDQDIVVVVFSAPSGVHIHCRSLPSFILPYFCLIFFLPFFFLLQQIEILATATNKDLLSPFQAATATAESPPLLPHRLSRADDRLLPLCLCAGKLLCFVNSLPPSGPDSRDIVPPFLRLSAPMCLKPRASELQWNM